MPSRIEELRNSQTINLNDEFYTCLNNGIIPFVKHKINLYKTDIHMSASVIIHHWNHAKFLPLLFKSFSNMDKNNIDVEFIITDSGSDEQNISMIQKVIDDYRGILNITALIHNLDDIRQEFNEKNPDGTFHGFPYISNSALNYCNNDIHCICDSSNIVNKEWLIGLCYPHYVYKNNLVIKARGADFTPESTVFIEQNQDRNIDEYLNLPYTYHDFSAGTGFGWSVKTDNVRSLGGFNQTLSCCGAVDDDFIYRALQNNYLYLGNEPPLGVHRIHNEGYEKNPRKPQWGYKMLQKIHIEKLDLFYNEPIKPVKILK